MIYPRYQSQSQFMPQSISAPMKTSPNLSIANITLLLLGMLLLLVSNLVNAADQDAGTAWAKIEAGAMVVDVRTAEEYAEGHLDNAINIPFETIAAEFAKRNIAKDTPVVVYCRSGRRSGIANESLVNAGYLEIYNGGGYESLASAKPSLPTQSK